MNREIKFRGKRLDNGEWVYGNLQQQAVNNEEWYITSITSPFNEFLNESHIINPKTVGQYTGLKDKNSKEIYEGDIFHLGDPNITYTIVYFDTAFRGKQNGASSYVGLDGWKDCIEVIGNIHESEVTNAKN